MLKLRHALLAAALLLPAALVPAPAAAQQKITIGVSLAQDDNPFYIAMLRGIRARAQELGWEVATVSANEDKVKQINGVQDLVARGVKGILISPIDAVGVNAAYDAAKAGKVPIVSVARGSTSPNQTLHVAMDEKQIGRDIAEWTAKTIGGEGKVAMLLGPSGAPTFRNLGDGYTEVMAKHPKIQIVSKSDGPLTRERGVKQTEDALVANPDLKAIYTANDDVALGAMQAVLAANKTDAGHRHERRAAGAARGEGRQARDDDRAQSRCCGAGSASTCWRNTSRATRSSRACSSSTSSSTRPTSTRSCRRLEGAAMADTAAAAKPGSDFVAQLEAANLHPLWDRFRTLTPVRPQAKDPPLLWRWKDIEPFTERAVVGGGDRRRRAARADPGQPGVRRRDGDDLQPDRGLHRARSRRPRAAAPAHLRGDPLRDARRGRRHHRQRPPLRHARGRPDPHAADVLARPHQRQRPPHHLVRRRQHPAHSPARCQFLRARRPQGQPVLAGRRRRREAVGRVRPGRRRRAARAGAFAEVSLFRRGDAAAVVGAAGRPGRRAHGALHQSSDRRRGDAGARLLRGAAAQGADDAAEAHHLQHDLPGGVGLRPLHRRRAHVRMVAARRVHHPALDLREPHAPKTATRACSSSPTNRRSSGSTCCARNCNKPARNNLR